MARRPVMRTVHGMSGILCVDPLTGKTVVVTPVGAKPGAARHEERLLPGMPAGCPFCRMAAAGPQTGQTVPDRIGNEDIDRLVERANESAFEIANLFPLFGPPNGTPGEVIGSASLVVTRIHATSLEQLTFAQLADVAALIAASHATHDIKNGHVACFVNVGLQSGSTQQHLHAQIVTAGLPFNMPCHLPAAPPFTGCRTCIDVHEAGGQLIGAGTGWTAYVPAAAGLGREIRISGTCGWDRSPAPAAETLTGLLSGVHAVLTAATATGESWAYNALLHHGPHPHAHVICRPGDTGIAYPFEFGVTPAFESAERLASRLRAAMPSA